MSILDIPAHEIQLGDVLGEGMHVWMLITGYRDPHKYMVVYWGPDNASLLLNGNYQDEEHRITYDHNDIVRVIRR